MWQRITDPTAWNNALRRFEWPHVLQTWEWGEFKSRWGWSAERWSLETAPGQPGVLIQLLRRRMSRLPVSVLYAPKGPAAAGEAAAYHAALEWLERRARALRAIWVKVDGDPLSDGFTAAEARQALRARGWRFSPNQVQYRNTVFTDLQRSDDELLAQMKPKWRYNIRLAEKRGVAIRPAGREDDALLYGMYAETGQRDGFIIREQPYYADAWRTMRAAGFIAEHDGHALAGLVLFRFKDRAWYFYGMSRTEGRENMPNHLLQWTAMRWARDQGCKVYDWWGAPDTLDESDPLWGVYRFKDGFGARFVEGLGAWDFAPSPLLYRLYLRLYRAAIGH